MLGRVLFAFVCLIIAAGLVLPLYPRDVVTSVVAAASDPVQPVAATDAFGCGDCSVADGDADMPLRLPVRSRGACSLRSARGRGGRDARHIPAAGY